LASGQVLLFDVDVKGALSIKAKYPQDALIIFVSPPSVDELRTRLLNRKTEDPATIERLMARVPMEMELASKFDHRVVNDDLQRASDEATQIVRAALRET
jgi:guanylate kinase